MSCTPEFGADVSDLFKRLTGYHKQEEYLRLLVAPLHMRDPLLEHIDREIATARAGGFAKVTVKANGLDDKKLCAKLYEASRAGVLVRLIIRGVCRLRPGVPGLSENIRVISVIGRFLEHHRVVSFHNRGSPIYLLGSADWMKRNLDGRVEVLFPVEDQSLKRELQGALDACLADGTNAWEMRPDGSYTRPTDGALAGEAAKSSGPLVQLARLQGVQEAYIKCTAEESRRNIRTPYI
mmetsp:Transcript_15134/g.49640  ORF Transcript_15134/g.49640 Transcript_15134/m.49640 type:complete len:237 (-) Transcript_15134:52-762(-)